MLKLVIIILLILVILSLSTGLVFLFKDTEKGGSKRTRYALGGESRVRLPIANCHRVRFLHWRTQNRH